MFFHHMQFTHTQYFNQYLARVFMVHLRACNHINHSQGVRQGSGYLIHFHNKARTDRLVPELRSKRRRLQSHNNI